MLRRGGPGGRRERGETGRREQRSSRRALTLVSAVSIPVLLGLVGYLGLHQNAQAGPETLQQRGDQAHRGLQQASMAPRNAESVEKTPGIGRPCSEADDFDYYSLGAAFEGLKLTTSGRDCAPPPPKVRSADGTLVYMNFTRQNVVAFLYGTCKPPSGGDGGCAPPLSISSSPACEQPRSLYRRYRGGGPPIPHENTSVRGAPAATFDEGPGRGGFRLEVYTGDARVVIAGADPEMVKRAADEMVATSTSPGGAKRPRMELPKPIQGAAEEDARSNPKC